MYSSFILEVPHLKVVVAKLCTQCWWHWKKSKSQLNSPWNWYPKKEN